MVFIIITVSPHNKRNATRIDEKIQLKALGPCMLVLSLIPGPLDGWVVRWAQEWEEITVFYL